MTTKEIAIVMHIRNYLQDRGEGELLKTELINLIEKFGISERTAYRYIAAYREYCEQKK